MIISVNKGGVANRLKCWASVIRISNNNNYKIKWDVLDDYNENPHILNCSFNKLFKNDVEIKSFSELDDININEFRVNPEFFIKDSDNLPNNFNNFTSNCRRTFRCRDKFKRDIDYMFNKIPKKIKYDYINCFKKIKLIDELQNQVNEFSKRFNDKTVSIHIRSWNRNGEISRRHSLYNVEKFENEMDNYKECNFFMSTDSQEVKDYFITESRFKNNIIFYNRKTSLDNSRDFPEGIQEDVIDLYLLSKNKIIIGSRFSTFTEVAWYLACCPRTIKIL